MFGTKAGIQATDFDMSLLTIIVLATVQGLAELLPISSSAHVIVAEKLLGLDPSSPEMTFLLVMLHTGTMFAVIFYFWRRWRDRFLVHDFARDVARPLIAATMATGLVGFALKHWIERVWLRGAAKQEVEALFSNLPLMAASLAVAGLLIIIAGKRSPAPPKHGFPSFVHALWIGVIQGICLPFRGFSRSGATISMGLLLDEPRAMAEEFSFALAVVLTPAVIAREARRLADAGGAGHWHAYGPGLLGMIFSFIAGLAALRWLSNWLERGRWSYFGYYCLAASAGVLAVYRFVG